MKLTDPDARAVDMLLDSSAQTGATAVGTAMDDDLAQRVTKADDMLKLLDYLPADEPSPSLVERTMRLIEQVPAPTLSRNTAAAVVATGPRPAAGQRAS